MPAASAYTATYLDGPAAVLYAVPFRTTTTGSPPKRKYSARGARGEIASGVAHLVRDLNAGFSAAQAQANVPKWVTKALNAAVAATGSAAVLSDFTAITTP